MSEVRREALGGSDRSVRAKSHGTGRARRVVGCEQPRGVLISLTTRAGCTTNRSARHAGVDALRFVASAVTLLALATVLVPRTAEAQYKNSQFGFEAGYFFLGESSTLDSHGLLLGMRGGYKVSDRWWLTARGAVSFRGERNLTNQTVVLFHLVPIDARYYFLSDDVRPFLGVTNSFQFLINASQSASDVFWGPGMTGGLEIKLRRDLFLGFQADAHWMFVFQGKDTTLLTLTSQLIFFL